MKFEGGGGGVCVNLADVRALLTCVCNDRLQGQTSPFKCKIQIICYLVV